MGIPFMNIVETSNRCSSCAIACYGRGKEQSLPPGLNNQELADKFNKFFYHQDY